MRPVYVRKLFEILRWLEVPQHVMARQLGVTDSTISMWASGQRPLAKRQKDAFLAFAAEKILEAYAPAKAALAAGIARAQPLPEEIVPPDLEQGPDFDRDAMTMLIEIEDQLPEGAPVRLAFKAAMDQVIFIQECLALWRLELVEGDRSLYHELAEALRILRPYLFMNEDDLRRSMRPEARQVLWQAGTTLTWCARTLEALAEGTAPEAEQLSSQLTQGQAHPDAAPPRPPERSRRRTAGSTGP